MPDDRVDHVPPAVLERREQPVAVPGLSRLLVLYRARRLHYLPDQQGVLTVLDGGELTDGQDASAAFRQITEDPAGDSVRLQAGHRALLNEAMSASTVARM